MRQEFTLTRWSRRRMALCQREESSALSGLEHLSDIVIVLVDHRREAIDEPTPQLGPC
jgi:hypothetical protein